LRIKKAEIEKENKYLAEKNIQISDENEDLRQNSLESIDLVKVIFLLDNQHAEK